MRDINKIPSETALKLVGGDYPYAHSYRRFIPIPDMTPIESATIALLFGDKDTHIIDNGFELVIYVFAEKVDKTSLPIRRHFSAETTTNPGR